MKPAYHTQYWAKIKADPVWHARVLAQRAASRTRMMLDPVKRAKRNAQASALLRRVKLDSRRLDNLRDRQRRYRLELRDRYQDFMAQLFCTNCLVSDTRVLQWAHLRHEKSSACVANVIYGDADKALLEMEKCVVLCANCHKTYDHIARVPPADASREQRRRSAFNSFVAELYCAHCFNADARVLEWAHIDAASKNGNVSDMVHGGITKLFVELNKCALLCANCHLIYDDALRA